MEWKILVFLSLILCVQTTYAAKYFMAFGDSLSDTGNLQSMSGGVVKLPYGMTYFKKATGRFSDGRLWLDFAMDNFGTQFLPPYDDGSNKNLDYTKGVNFAIAGATANEDFASPTLPSGISLDHQIDSFVNFKKDCSSSHATSHFPSTGTVESGVAIILIGGNDINYMIIGGSSPSAIVAKIPDVIGSIEDGINRLAKEGIKSFLVMNLPPQGCLPLYLQQSVGSSPKYDGFGCLEEISKVSMEFNKALMAMLEGIDAGENIVYGDVFAAALTMYKSPEDYGFDPASKLQACCGSGSGTYNCDASKPGCGCSTSTVCKSLSKHMNWDGVHFTEKFYQKITDFVMNQGFYMVVKGSSFF
ncbi:GDSL esterase/lipase LIP-4 [Selaginella moellendorffii]|nr:GDSL esterase/lipase LIP-4 [Selaginella moellendorffii]|eukprot:XP_002963808.2 GDSL esterase/lipase LIP-4 [Selaginella moellendorffii]